MIHTPYNSVELVNPPQPSLYLIPFGILLWEMLQWYFCALADSYNCLDYHLDISVIVARNP
jgi:hypothetical protein